MTGTSLGVVPYPSGAEPRTAVRDDLAALLPARLATGTAQAGWRILPAAPDELAGHDEVLDDHLRLLADRLAARREPREWRRGPARLRIDGTRGLLMGIVNVTPDSFSDGGRFLEPEAAVSHGLRLVEEGAAIVDVGGESTRPGSDPVPAAEERRRVLPVVKALVASGVPVSVDTRRPPLARECLAEGALLLNDVTGLSDPGMRAVVRDARAPAVMMHMRGDPKTMQEDPQYEDVLLEVFAEMEGRSLLCEADGVPRETLLFDPGLGFSKRTGAGIEDNVALIAGLPLFDALGLPIVVGASRKRFLGTLTGRPVGERRDASVAAAVAARLAGADILRVHDVAATRGALQVADALLAERRREEPAGSGPDHRGPRPSARNG